MSCLRNENVRTPFNRLNLVEYSKQDVRPDDDMYEEQEPCQPYLVVDYSGKRSRTASSSGSAWMGA